MIDEHTPTEQERFWSKVDKAGPGCWAWTAHTTPRGYGTFWLDGEKRLAHRVAYEMAVGAIPDGLTIDHLCRNPGCVNPAHLEPVTGQVNTLRGYGPSAQAARKTHCPRGHPLSGDNLYRHRGARICLACKRQHDRLHKRERRRERV